jgi:alkylation response protein AidB-like acyl-CoA dehydrogenase
MNRSPLAAARELAPRIRASADVIEAERELPKDLFEAIADAGLFHLLLPRTLGCPELDLPTYVSVIEELGRADASTAWIVNQCGVFATFASRMPRDVARAVWIDTPRSIVANSPLPTATAVVVPGGFRVTGRQGFSTGCRHAAWLAAHAQVVEDGQPRRREDGEVETRWLFVPAAEAALLDTWQVRGMRGTGTHHFAVNDVFVPAERGVGSALGTTGLVEKGPLYQIPPTLLFGAGDASVALGVARGALEIFSELAGTKSARAQKGVLREQVLVQADVGHAESQLRAGRALLTETVREVWNDVSAEGTITPDQRVALRIAITHPIWLAAQIVDALYHDAGATAIYESHPLQRQFQDIHVITQHLQGRRAHYALIGRQRLGLTVEDDTSF